MNHLLLGSTCINSTSVIIKHGHPLFIEREVKAEVVRLHDSLSTYADSQDLK